MTQLALHSQLTDHSHNHSQILWKISAQTHLGLVNVSSVMICVCVQLGPVTTYLAGSAPLSWKQGSKLKSVVKNLSCLSLPEIVQIFEWFDLFSDHSRYKTWSVQLLHLVEVLCFHDSRPQVPAVLDLVVKSDSDFSE